MQNDLLKNLIREMTKIYVSYQIETNDWSNYLR